MKLQSLFFSAFAVFSLLIVGCASNGISPKNSSSDLSFEEAKLIAIDFINQDLLPPGQAVKVQNFTDEGSLYRMEVEVNGQILPAYLTKDGKTFFPQAMDIEQVRTEKATAQKAADEQKQQQLGSIPKAEKPVVELFVMSHCPFGTQMQKGMLPVLDALGESVDFQLKFNTYAMHQYKELVEQNLQHCIKEETPDKLLTYLGCFLEDENSERCLGVIEETEASYDTCLADLENEFNTLANFEDRSTWMGQFPSYPLYQADNEKYGVRGSPTLVINGQVVTTARDSASLLETVCAGFEDAPEACDTQLPSTQPSPGFGYNTSAAGTSATTANCGV